MNVNEFDKAQMKHDLRKLYKDKGYNVCLQVLYEFFVASELMCQVILEEKYHDESKS